MHRLVRSLILACFHSVLHTGIHTLICSVMTVPAPMRHFIDLAMHLFVHAYATQDQKTVRKDFVHTQAELALLAC